MHSALATLEHRPWPLPAGPWSMAQNWHDLLFAHWPVAAEVLRPLIPRSLKLDGFEGQSWIGVVPFRMAGVRLRGMPAVPWLSAFPELNVRTYVAADGKPGVWFFSLDAANRIAVEIARAWFHLPYFRARMAMRREADEIFYASQRTDQQGRDENFEARYAASGEPFQARPGTLEHFLTERYCLYAQRPDGRMLRSEIHHAPWELQMARADIARNTMADNLNMRLAGEPLLHFSKLQKVVVWAPEQM